MEAYYYTQLNKAQQSAYHAMKTGFTAIRPSFPVPKLENHELSDIFFKLRLDCPEIFYVVGFTYRFYQGAESVELVPEYLFPKGKIQEHQKALAARVTKLLRPAQGLTPLEQEKYIHDFICENVRYDKLKKPYSHEIIGPLGQGVGVCEGIAKAVKILCDGLGLPCIIAVSEAAPEKGVKYRHAWNIVTIGGQRYHLDATFDGTLSRGVTTRYDYFNLYDGSIFRDHQPALYPLPACTDSSRSYYREKKLSFTKMEDVVKRAGQAARKGTTLTFHWRGGCLTRDILEELLQKLEELAKQKDRHAQVALNWPQAVIQVAFPKELPQEALVDQEANEGEQDS